MVSLLGPSSVFILQLYSRSRADVDLGRIWIRSPMSSAAAGEGLRKWGIFPVAHYYFSVNISAVYPRSYCAVRVENTAIAARAFGVVLTAGTTGHRSGRTSIGDYN